MRKSIYLNNSIRRLLPRPNSNIIGHWSLATGYWSWVICHVIGASVRPTVRPTIPASDCPSARAFVRPYNRSPVRPSVRPYVRSSNHSSFRLPIRPSVRPTVRPSVRQILSHYLQWMGNQQASGVTGIRLICEAAAEPEPVLLGPIGVIGCQTLFDTPWIVLNICGGVIPSTGLSHLSPLDPARPPVATWFGSSTPPKRTSNSCFWSISLAWIAFFY